jgi:hypothetical protein
MLVHPRDAHKADGLVTWIGVDARSVEPTRGVDARFVEPTRGVDARSVGSTRDKRR